MSRRALSGLRFKGGLVFDFTRNRKVGLTVKVAKYAPRMPGGDPEFLALPAPSCRSSRFCLQGLAAGVGFFLTLPQINFTMKMIVIII